MMSLEQTLINVTGGPGVNYVYPVAHLVNGLHTRVRSSGALPGRFRVHHGAGI